MKRVSLLFWVVLGGFFILPLNVWSQCPNLDFSYGTLQFWKYYRGSCAGGKDSISQTSPILGQYVIFSNMLMPINFRDEKCSTIPKVPSGYNFSCRIGNDSAGAKVNAIEYETTVDSNNSLLIISYAWVMQNSNHILNDSPQINIIIKDSARNIVSSLNFVAQDSMPNLTCDTNDIIARNWETIGYNLEEFIGQKIKIYFETRDCTCGNHFAYAYVVAECLPLRIESTYCQGTVANLIAPNGFVSYEWTRSADPSWKANTQQIKISSPLDGEVFTVTVENTLGGKLQLNIVIVKTSIDAKFKFGYQGQGTFPPFYNWYDTCARTATFIDLSTVHNSKKDRIMWTIHGTNAISNDSLFTYTFPEPSTAITYLVRLTVFAQNGCSDTFSQQITIYPSPKVRINGSNKLCEGTNAYLTTDAIRSTFVEHYWSWKKTNGATGNYTGDSLLIDSPGTYCVMSKDTNGCYAYDTLVVKSEKFQWQNVSVLSPLCYGDANGRFSYSGFSGSSGGFVQADWTVWNQTLGKLDTVSVISNPNSQTFRKQKAGTYTFYGLDGEGCIIRDTITIQQPDSLYFSATAKETNCFKDNGEIDYEVIGGTSPYNISIIGAITMQTTKAKAIIANLPAGVYIAKIEDKNNCRSTDTVIVPADAVQDIPLISISLTEKDTTIAIAKNALLHVIFTPANACNQDVHWHSENPKIATVNANGRVTGISNGVTYIVVTSDEGGFRDSCKVTVSSVGIKQLQVTNYELQVFPNPTNGQLTINNEQLTINNVELFDIYGKNLLSLQSSLSPEIIIDISHLQSGVYYIKINSLITKIIKI